MPADLLPQLGRQRRRGRFLDQLLVPALDRAVALAEVQDLAVLVGQDLHLDVARVLDELLEIHGAVAERGFGLRARGVKTGDERRLVARDAHAASAAARRGLDHHRVTDLLRDVERALLVVDRAVRSGHDGNTGFFRELSCGDLVAELRDRLRLGTDEVDLARAAHLGEVRVLRQESVARMDRFDVGHFGGGDDRRNVEVRLRARRRTDADRVVRLPQMYRVGVGR